VSAPPALQVLFLDSWYPDRERGSGSAVAISGLAGGLRSLGHTVTVLRPGTKLLPPDLARLAANAGFRRRLRALQPDLVVGFDLDGCFLGRLAAPYVVSLKGVMADERRHERGWNRARFELLSRLESRNARRADRVIVTSEHSRRAAIAAYGLSPDLVGVVPEGIDVEAWTGLPGERPARDPSTPTIVSVARQYRRKNTAVLIRAIPAVRQRVPGARLRVVGDGPELPRLRALVRALDLGDAVTLIGSVGGLSELRAEFARADVFCLPSRQEGFGIVFLEAMAAGLPIVAADCGAIPETAPAGEVSLLVGPDDVEGLAAALIRLLTDRSLHGRLAAGGLARWARFGWTAVAEKFLTEVGLD